MKVKIPSFYESGCSFMYYIHLVFSAQKMKLSLKDFFSKCDQIRDLFTFTEEILNGKLHFCAVFKVRIVGPCTALAAKAPNRTVNIQMQSQLWVHLMRDNLPVSKLLTRMAHSIFRISWMFRENVTLSMLL